MTAETVVAVIAPEREKKEQGALARVLGWVVRTAEDYTALDSFLAGLADLKKEIIADFKDAKEKTADAKRAATVAHKAVADQEEGHLSVIEEARRIGKQKLFDFEEAGRKETARLQAIEDEKAETERKRVLALAKIAEKKGDDSKAAALREEAFVPAPRLATSVPERTTVLADYWSATVGGARRDGTKTDPLFVKKAIERAVRILAAAKSVEGKAALADLIQAQDDAEYMVYDVVRLNKKAKSDKDAFRLGGVAFTSRKV